MDGGLTSPDVGMDFQACPRVREVQPWDRPGGLSPRLHGPAGRFAIMPAMPLERITLFCFAASYAVAFGLEMLRSCGRVRSFRWLALGFGGAGLLAQSLYLRVHAPPLTSQFGTLLILGWVLVIFYLYGSVHYRHRVWGVFVLPLVCALVGLASTFDGQASDFQEAEHFWTLAHIGLMLLAAVGVCVGFLASVMYLVQAHRLRAKHFPGKGLRLLSLERLEAMNRRAINLAFPLLTAGLLVGLFLHAYPAGMQCPGPTRRSWPRWSCGVFRCCFGCATAATCVAVTLPC